MSLGPGMHHYIFNIGLLESYHGLFTGDLHVQLTEAIISHWQLLSLIAYI